MEPVTKSEIISVQTIKNESASPIIGEKCEIQMWKLN